MQDWKHITCSVKSSAETFTGQVRILHQQHESMDPYCLLLKLWAGGDLFSQHTLSTSKGQRGQHIVERREIFSMCKRGLMKSPHTRTPGVTDKSRNSPHCSFFKSKKETSISQNLTFIVCILSQTLSLHCCCRTKLDLCVRCSVSV